MSNNRMTPKRILRRIIYNYERKLRWHQNAIALDNRGNEIDPHHDPFYLDTKRASLVGAINYASRQMLEENPDIKQEHFLTAERKTYNILIKAIKERGQKGIISFNDDKETTFQEVLNILRTTAKLKEAQ